MNRTGSSSKKKAKERVNFLLAWSSFSQLVASSSSAPAACSCSFDPSFLLFLTMRLKLFSFNFTSNLNTSSTEDEDKSHLSLCFFFTSWCKASTVIQVIQLSLILLLFPLCSKSILHASEDKGARTSRDQLYPSQLIWLIHLSLKDDYTEQHRDKVTKVMKNK